MASSRFIVIKTIKPKKKEEYTSIGGSSISSDAPRQPKRVSGLGTPDIVPASGAPIQQPTPPKPVDKNIDYRPQYYANRGGGGGSSVSSSKTTPTEEAFGMSLPKNVRNLSPRDIFYNRSNPSTPAPPTRSEQQLSMSLPEGVRQYDAKTVLQGYVFAPSGGRNQAQIVTSEQSKILYPSELRASPPSATRTVDFLTGEQFRQKQDIKALRSQESFGQFAARSSLFGAQFAGNVVPIIPAAKLFELGFREPTQTAKGFGSLIRNPVSSAKQFGIDTGKGLSTGDPASLAVVAAPVGVSTVPGFARSFLINRAVSKSVKNFATGVQISGAKTYLGKIGKVSLFEERAVLKGQVLTGPNVINIVGVGSQKFGIKGKKAAGQYAAFATTEGSPNINRILETGKSVTTIDKNLQKSITGFAGSQTLQVAKLNKKGIENLFLTRTTPTSGLISVASLSPEKFVEQSYSFLGMGSKQKSLGRSVGFRNEVLRVTSESGYSSNFYTMIGFGGKGEASVTSLGRLTYDYLRKQKYTFGKLTKSKRAELGVRNIYSQPTKQLSYYGKLRTGSSGSDVLRLGTRLARRTSKSYYSTRFRNVQKGLGISLATTNLLRIKPSTVSSSRLNSFQSISLKPTQSFFPVGKQSFVPAQIPKLDIKPIQISRLSAATMLAPRLTTDLFPRLTPSPLTNPPPFLPPIGGFRLPSLDFNLGLNRAFGRRIEQEKGLTPDLTAFVFAIRGNLKRLKGRKFTGISDPIRPLISYNTPRRRR